jgi:L-gulonolactone oxidase
LQVDSEKKCVTAQGGITLQDLHEHLAQHGLAMSNVGSISEQTLAGIVTTATHGSGISYRVIPSDVQAITVLLADGSRVTCTANEHPDLFNATICGLGSTGLILTIQLGVESAFRLKEVQKTLFFDDFLDNFDNLVHSAEHARFWWLPPSDRVRVSLSDRTSEVWVIKHVDLVIEKEILG